MTDHTDLDALDHSDADSDVGSIMFDAVTAWSRRNNNDDPTIVSRVMVIVECHDKEGRWLDRGGFTADGVEMAPWESLGFLEYAALRERSVITDACDTGDEDE